MTTHTVLVLIRDGNRERAVKVIVSAPYPEELNLEALAQKAWSQPLRTMSRRDITIKVETLDSDKQESWDRKLLRLRQLKRWARLRYISVEVALASVVSCLIAFVISRSFGTSFVQVFTALLAFFLVSRIAWWLDWHLTRTRITIKNVTLYVIAALAYADETGNGQALDVGFALLLFSLPLLLVMAFDWTLFADVVESADSKSERLRRRKER